MKPTLIFLTGAIVGLMVAAHAQDRPAHGILDATGSVVNWVNAGGIDPNGVPRMIKTDETGRVICAP